MLDSLTYERYSRHIMLPEIGEAGQEKLLAAKVLVIGAGGLGCPVLQYLTAAGVGTIGIADDDVVSLSNLQRQVLYSIDDIEKLKAVVAVEKLKRNNGGVTFNIINSRITNANAFDIFKHYDIIIDCSDNFSTRYLVNDACVLLARPLIYGSIFRFEGQVAIFNFKGSANYRDLFPIPPSINEVPDCSEAGVLGVLPGIIGSLMANEVLKLITGVGNLFVNKVLTYNSLHNSFYEIEIEKDSKAIEPIPSGKEQFERANYDLTCTTNDHVNEIDVHGFQELIGESLIIDVRELGEQPAIKEFEFRHIPLSELKAKTFSFSTEPIVLFCQSGKRSKEAADIIKTTNPQLKQIYSLKGGILQWKNQQK